MIESPWSTAAAWWGAIVATIVGIWNVYTWHRAERVSLTVTVNTGMRWLPQPDTVMLGRTMPSDKMVVSVANAGNRRTTLKTVTFVAYGSEWKRFLYSLRRPKFFSYRVRRKNVPAYCEINARPDLLGLPAAIGPGEAWTAVLAESAQLKQLAANHHLIYCEVYDVLSDKPVSCRVEFRNS
jgi:hypothetical protein